MSELNKLSPQTNLRITLTLLAVGLTMIATWVVAGVVVDGGEEGLRLRASLEGDGIHEWLLLRELDLGVALLFAAVIFPAAVAIQARRTDRDPLAATGLPEWLFREPLVLISALTLIGSLWLPWFWYENEAHHNFTANAWLVLKYADWAFVAGAVVAIALAVTLWRGDGLRLRRDRIANLIGGLSVAALAVLVFRLILRPFSDADPFSDATYHTQVVPNAGIALAVLGASLGLFASTRLAPGTRTLVDAIWGRTAGLRVKRCPACTEHVLASAVVCRHCGHRFDEPA